MKPRLKRTCNGCKAFEGSPYFFCALGFNSTKTIRGWGCDVSPNVVCPKPKTYADYFEAFDKKQEATK